MSSSERLSMPTQLAGSEAMIRRSSSRRSAMNGEEIVGSMSVSRVLVGDSLVADGWHGWQNAGASLVNASITKSCTLAFGSPT